MAIIGISGKKQSGKDTTCRIIQYLMYNNNYKGSHVIVDIPDALSDKNLSLDLLEKHSGWQRKLFADKLKDIVCLLIGCTREQLEDPIFKETPLGEEWDCWLIPDVKYPLLFPIDVDIEWIASSRGGNYVRRRMTPRMLLQLLGTECGRKIIHPNVWINSLMSEYKKEFHGSITLGGGDFDYEKVAKKIKEEQSVYPNWIITDVRFANEAKAIKDRGGIVIRVNRPFKQYDRTCLACNTGFDFTDAYYPDPENRKNFFCPKCKSINHAAVLYQQDTHESETALDNYEFDYTITNDKRIEELINKVELVLERANLLK